MALNVLVVGATGSVGRLVVEEALRQRHTVRALARSASRARGLPVAAQVVLGDLTRPESLAAAVAGVDAVIFTHGSDGSSKTGAETVDYGGVRNVLQVLAMSPARITLMTAIGVTSREGPNARLNDAHDWKRRAERLVRASGRPYTIVRPGWFDYNRPEEQQLTLLQGDRRHAGDPSDGVIARRQLAQVLVHSLSEASADHKTFELVAVSGPAQTDYSALFAPLVPDVTLDGVQDLDNLPISDEFQRLRDDLATVPRPGSAEGNY